jgi:2-keto-4-pentenoate hydratase
MTLEASIDAVTQALLAARRDHAAAADDTLATALPDAAAAYAVQQRCAAALGWFGAATPPSHWKSGGPSLDNPLTHAALPPAGVWTSPARAGDWPFHQRLVESEIALRLARPVDAALAATLDVNGARALIDAMTVSIELVDSRWRQGLAAPALLRLADLASHAALVLGDWVPFVARDWPAQVCRLQIGAQAPVERRGSHSLGDPCQVLPQWLRHATQRHGTLPAGTVVTTGTWAGAPPAQAGDLVTVTFDGIGQASVQL